MEITHGFAHAKLATSVAKALHRDWSLAGPDTFPDFMTITGQKNNFVTVEFYGARVAAIPPLHRGQKLAPILRVGTSAREPTALMDLHRKIEASIAALDAKTAIEKPTPQD